MISAHRPMADGLKCFIARPEFRPTTGEISVPTQSCQGPGSRNVLALERFECRHRFPISPALPARKPTFIVVLSVIRL